MMAGRRYLGLVGALGIAAVLAAPGSASAAEERRPMAAPGGVLDQFAQEPSIRETQEVAMQYALVSDATLNSYQRAGRWTKLLPRTRLRYDSDAADDTQITVDSAGERTLRVEDDRDSGMDVQVEWRLDELMMGPTRIQTIRETARMVQLRDDILDEVTKIYYDRRRLQVELLMSPPQDPRARVTKDLRLEELTANIDALTGGWFSKRIRAGAQRGK